jgi:hypothetical protein
VKRKEVIMGVLAVVVLGLATFRIVQWTRAPDYPPVTYLFWCESDHLHNFDQVKAAGRQIHPQGGSDSVLVCAAGGCEKPSYPVERCQQCGTRYLLYIFPQTECPTCRPEVAQAAAARGINLTPAGLPSR